MTPDYFFDIATPLGFRVHTTRNYWHYVITFKHPDMHDRLDDVLEALSAPSEIRRSSKYSDVCLFYRVEYPGRYICVVAKRLNGEGFFITAYPADYIKKGELLWPR